MLILTKLHLTFSVLQFEEALNQIDPLEGIRKLVDPRLKDNYPMDSVLKVGIISLKRNFECYFLRNNIE
jgi:hypothetical protein